MTIYDRIRNLREQHGMTQEQLAEKTGYKTRSAINKIESGLRDINQSQIVLFAKALNVSPAYLMGWEDEAHSEISQRDIIAEKYTDTFKRIDFIIKSTKSLKYTYYICDLKNGTNFANIPEAVVFDADQFIQNTTDYIRSELYRRFESYKEGELKTKSFTPILNAAHAMPGASEEDKQHDEDIMDDENF